MLWFRMLTVTTGSSVQPSLKSCF